MRFKTLYISSPSYAKQQREITTIGHFTVVYLIAKPLTWNEAEGDLVVIETSI